MALSKRDLETRWKTEDGKDRLAKVVKAIQEKEKWEYVLVGLPGVDEIRGGRDLRGVDLDSPYFEGADLNDCHFEGSFLPGANFKGANLTEALFEDTLLYSANFEGADLRDAIFIRAECEDCSLGGAKLSGTYISPRTDFRGSNIEAMLCRHETLNRIKYNNRLLNWEDWYKKHPVAQWPVRLFWWLSDYGTDQKNLFVSFALGAFAFAVLYWQFPDTIIGMSIYQGETVTVPLWIRSFYFSIVTMTTLGFGDIHASPHSIWGHVLLTAQVLMGYMLLGALISRLAVLFQSGGPTDISNPDSLDELEKEKIQEALRE